MRIDTPWCLCPRRCCSWSTMPCSASMAALVSSGALRSKWSTASSATESTFASPSASTTATAGTTPAASMPCTSTSVASHTAFDTHHTASLRIAWGAFLTRSSTTGNTFRCSISAMYFGSSARMFDSVHAASFTTSRDACRSRNGIACIRPCSVAAAVCLCVPLHRLPAMRRAGESKVSSRCMAAKTRGSAPSTAISRSRAAFVKLVK
mmetsp:Transcript_17802/g.55261  ORF Transcript_17802/g.55261 Transcript_17802/m.55261 type:complete len:208 (+) Transcript_17802:503-1126(+)